VNNRARNKWHRCIEGEKTMIYIYRSKKRTRKERILGMNKI
jgi:hypothetical protein